MSAYSYEFFDTPVAVTVTVGVVPLESEDSTVSDEGPALGSLPGGYDGVSLTGGAVVVVYGGSDSVGIGVGVGVEIVGIDVK